ncbi:MAG: hypothetical protein RR566_15500, partial [Comamonas sp.]
LKGIALQGHKPGLKKPLPCSPRFKRKSGGHTGIICTRFVPLTARKQKGQKHFCFWPGVNGGRYRI